MNDLLTQRALHVLAVVVGAVAVAGYFVGTRPLAGGVSGAPGYEVTRDAADEEGLVPAPSYAELGGDGPGAIAARQQAAFTAMLGNRPAPSLDTGLPQRTEAERLATLEARAARRAYDGAPPRIPHDIGQMETGDCVSCHQDGVRIGPRVAPAMSHEAYSSCTQCHVVEEAPMPGAERALETGPPIASTFVGLESPERGVRAWEGAPPQIPHATRMRERCASCHGSLAEGLRTSHPWRQSCTQCHAPSAAFDQGPSSELGEIGAP